MDELTSAVMETGLHLFKQEWGQRPRLYALTRRRTLNSVEREDLPPPVRDVAQGALVPIEQDPLPPGEPAEVLARIHWPEEVEGCALVTDLLVLPPTAKKEAPDEATAAEQSAAGHRGGREARLTVGVLRDGQYASCLQLLGEEGFLVGDALADDVVAALLGTF